MKTEPTEAGDQGVIKDPAAKRVVPRQAKPGGGDLKGTPLGKRAAGDPEQGELFSDSRRAA